MAIYGDGKHDNGRIAHPKGKRPDLAAKRKEDKEKLVREVLAMLMDEPYEYRGFISDLLTSELRRWSTTNLKSVL
jgi:hypothetical protein